MIEGRKMVMRVSGWFGGLVNEPVIIDEPGNYTTRSGEVVTITAVSTRHDFACTGTYQNGTKEGWHKSGHLYVNQGSQNDIVKKTV